MSTAKDISASISRDHNWRRTADTDQQAVAEPGFVPLGICPEPGGAALYLSNGGRHARFFGISLAIHVAFIISVTGFARAPRIQPPVEIDFTINSARTDSKPPTAAPFRKEAPAPARKSIASSAEQARPSTSPAPLIKEDTQPVQKHSEVATSQIPQRDQADTRPSETAPRSDAGGIKGTGIPSSAPSAGNNGGRSVRGGETMRTRYLKEQFSYIRDKIASNVRYPRQAKRMGWSGVAHVSFVIEENGGVSDVKVVKSSQVGLLDEEASESVRRSAPFPRPPVRARIVIPVEYVIG